MATLFSTTTAATFILFCNAILQIHNSLFLLFNSFVDSLKVSFKFTCWTIFNHNFTIPL